LNIQQIEASLPVNRDVIQENVEKDWIDLHFSS